jgi:biotin carboxyl carrier protein
VGLVKLLFRPECQTPVMKATRWLVLSIVSISLAWTLIPEAAATVQTKKPVVKNSAAKSTKKKAPVKKRKKSPVKKKTTTVKKPVVKADPLNTPMVGTWYTLDSDGKFAKANKFVFTATGEFNYVGPGWKSGGTFNLREGIVTLSWLQIDGQPVKPGTIKKQIPMAEKRFQIERFAYGKAS